MALGRQLVKFLGIPIQIDHPVVPNDDIVCLSQRFVLTMGGVDKALAKFLLQFAQFATHPNAHKWIKRRQRLVAGTKLGEDGLSEIYGVSRTIVYASLQSLSHQQIVEIRRNRGAFVAQPSLVEAHEVFEARKSLEPRTARRAALKALPKDTDILKAHILQEHAAIDSGDRGRALYVSGRFHLEIADKDGDQAEELMQSHLVDLHSALNLHERKPVVQNLKHI